MKCSNLYKGELVGRRRKSSGSGVGILVLFGIGLVIAYWQYLLAFAVIGGSIYLIARAIKNASARRQLTSNSAGNFGITITIGNDSDRDIKSNATFYSEETTISLGTQEVPAYLVYISKRPEQLPHVISSSLPLGTPDPDFKAKMGYWPQFSAIGENDRATYIAWLASGRSNANADIGFVFLYFYGLEYRAIYERKDHLKIFNEALRLYGIYANKSRSFAGYCSKFISWLVLSNPEWEQELQGIRKLISDDSDAQDEFEAILSRLSPSTFDAQSLFDALISTPGFQNDAVVTPIKEEFKRVFLKRLNGRQPTKSDFDMVKVSWSYHTATSLHFNAVCDQRTAVASEEAKKWLRPIWQSCISDLSAYSNMRSVGNPLAVLQLPESLQADLGGKQLAALKRFTDSQKEMPILITEACTICGVIFPEKASIAFSRKLRDQWQSIGYSIEPDPDSSARAYKADDTLFIYKPIEGKVNADRMKKAVLFFDLGMSVAKPNESSFDKKIEFVVDFIGKQLRLTAPELERLRYRGLLYKAGQFAAHGVARKLSGQLKVRESNAVAKFLMSVALVDGVLQNRELKAIEKIFKTFGFPEGTLNKLLSDFGAATPGPVLLKEGKVNARRGSAIPQQEQETAISEIRFDEAALKNAFSDAQEVAKILDTVFVEDQPSPETSNDKATSQKPATIATTGLKPAEQSLLEWLVANGDCEITAVEGKCRELGLLYGSVVDRINTWSESVHEGGLLLEEDGSRLCIDRSLLGEESKSA